MVKSILQLIPDRMQGRVPGTLKHLSDRLKALPKLGSGKDVLTRQAIEGHLLQRVQRVGTAWREAINR
jgi:hypothetical protein